MGSISGAGQLINCLVTYGISRIYGVPGEETADLLFAIENSDIEFIICRHEQEAAFMASMEGHLTGLPGVCFSTLGPGATNLVTGIASANEDHTPLIVITAQADQKRQHQNSHQLIDVISMMRPLVKWSHRLSDKSQITETVCKSFKIAMSEPTGACHIELPTDIAGQEMESEEPVPLMFPEVAGIEDKHIDIIIELIFSSKKPLIIAGGGTIRNDASRELTALVEKSNLPLVTTFMGKGVINDSLTQSLGTIGLGIKEIQDEIVNDADLILSIGYDLGEYHPKYWNSKRNSKIIHIGGYAADVYKEYLPICEFISHIPNSINKITRRISDDYYTDWYVDYYEKIKREKEEHLSFGLEGKQTVPMVLETLNQLSPEKSILISDVGVHKMWVAKMYDCSFPNSCYISNNFASMGISLPSSIAACLCRPDHKIISVIGDGGFMMNCQALETAHRYGANMTIVLLVDKDYGLISWKQERESGKSFGTTFQNPDFKKFIESFGIDAHEPSTSSELTASLKKSLSSNGIEVVIVQVDDEVNASLINN